MSTPLRFVAGRSAVRTLRSRPPAHRCRYAPGPRPYGKGGLAWQPPGPGAPRTHGAPSPSDLGAGRVHLFSILHQTKPRAPFLRPAAHVRAAEPPEPQPGLGLQLCLGTCPLHPESADRLGGPEPKPKNSDQASLDLLYSTWTCLVHLMASTVISKCQETVDSEIKKQTNAQPSWPKQLATRGPTQTLLRCPGPCSTACLHLLFSPCPSVICLPHYAELLEDSSPVLSDFVPPKWVGWWWAPNEMASPTPPDPCASSSLANGSSQR